MGFSNDSSTQLLLSKPAKQVGRRRSRNEVTKILRNGAKAIQVSNTEKVNLEWSWGNKDATSSNKAVIRNSTEQGLRAPMEKVRNFALVSLCPLKLTRSIMYNRNNVVSLYFWLLH